MLTLRKLQVVRVATAALLESQSPVLQRFWQGGNEDSASSSAKVLASVKMPWLARAQSTQIETASPSAGVIEASACAFPLLARPRTSSCWWKAALQAIRPHP